VGEPVGRRDKGGSDTGLEGGVAGIGDDIELGPRPGAVQFPGGAQGADEVVAPLDDDPGDIGQVIGVAQELIGLQEGPVDEVVTLDARQTQGHMGVGEVGLQVGVGQQGGGAPRPEWGR
jgi:hypothetical protein